MASILYFGALLGKLLLLAYFFEGDLDRLEID